MSDTNPCKPTALVVEADEAEREMVAILLEESEMGVIQCESADAALRVLENPGSSLSMMFTDAKVSGEIDGVELAHFARTRHPHIHLVITSDRTLRRALPNGARLMSKPWIALDVLREAARSVMER
jgi:DNA-binding NtrC family response regulator